jgi:hypothetical protein
VIWKLSDGTTVELGGSVEGDSVLAQRLRYRLERGGVRVTIWPPPGGDVELDPADAALLNAWLDAEIEWLERVRGSTVKLTERPEGIPPLPPPPWKSDPDAPADRVY